MAPQHGYAAPTGEIEVALAGIWSELLKIQRVGREDDFFALGGQSQQAMTLLERIAERMAVELPFTAIFKCPTIDQMAQLVRRRLEDRDSVPDVDEADLPERAI